MKKIESFSSVSLRITGMRANIQLYEILKTDEGVSVSFYEGSWEYMDNVEKEDCLVSRVEGGEELYTEVLNILNENKVYKWDGFRKSARNVLDGYMFTFEARVNNDEKIYANGSNAYPKNYNKFIEAIEELLKQ